MRDQLFGLGGHVVIDAMTTSSSKHARRRLPSRIPLHAIERVETVTEAPERWRRRHGIHRADTLLVTPFDKPNCVLVLTPDAGVTLRHWQVRRNAPRYVPLYLDRPELLAAQVGRTAG